MAQRSNGKKKYAQPAVGVLRFKVKSSCSGLSQGNQQEHAVSKIMKPHIPNRSLDWNPEDSNIITFAATDLPDIPIIPEFLQELLDDLRVGQNYTKLMDHKRAKKAKRYSNVTPLEYPETSVNSSSHDSQITIVRHKTSLNGFMAFRSFYTQHISAPTSQRELSTALSKAWSQDENLKNIWTRYAADYNSQSCKNGNVPFVSWLTNIKDGMTGERNNWSRSLMLQKLSLAATVSAKQVPTHVVDIIRSDDSSRYLRCAEVSKYRRIHHRSVDILLVDPEVCGPSVHSGLH